MAKVLFVHIRYPEFDRCSGDLRVANMLRILARRHELALHILHQPQEYLHGEQSRPYRNLLAELKVAVRDGDLASHLRRERYDAIVIEFWYVAGPVLETIRVLQPQARVLVDTEHIYFYSDRLREAVLGPAVDSAPRAQNKRTELAAYSGADAIITTTDEDRDVVLAEDPAIVCRSIPNIHELPAAPVGDAAGRQRGSMIFVGNFRRNPSNTDSMLWFCREVLPLVRAKVPAAHLSIVGNMPPAEVQALGGDAVTVTGYVTDTAPYLDASLVSVCPLRFGAGLKGKIGEALSRGVPVVSTSVGTQGMQIDSGREILVADSPAEFAAAVVRLLEDPALWRESSLAGRAFLERNFSTAAVERRLDDMFGDLAWLPIKRLPPATRLVRRVRAAVKGVLAEHVLWRLQR